MMNLLFLYILFLQQSFSLTITSDAFEQEGYIPAKYTCEGGDVQPPLQIGNIPENTSTLAIIMDDPDAIGKTFDHWIVYNIDPDTLKTVVIPEATTVGTYGANGTGKNVYKGPCPPEGMHHYHFKVYALDIKLKLGEGATKSAVEAAMKGHILSKGELVGLYKKTGKQ